MNWTLALVQAILIAAFVALFNHFFSTRQKHLDFNYDYKKYILDKRKRGYDEIELLITQLKKTLNECFESPQAFSLDASFKMHENLLDIHGFWISKQMQDVLFELIIELDMFQKKFDNSIRPESTQLTSAWMPLYHIQRRIEAQYFVDIMSLDDISSFKSNRDVQYEKYIEQLKERQQKLSSW
jgi:hypothetical protein